MRVQNLLYYAFAIIVAISLAITLVDADPFPLSAKEAEAIERVYGKGALKRIAAWKELMATQKGKSEIKKLELVNNFFNKREFVSDLDVWGVEDYWATPTEFLSKDAGDCEDYSIAKYFTLRELGVAEGKLRITYVRALEIDLAHMVLTYADKPGDEPLVLDNLDGRLMLASKRKDLRPIYSFNGSGLWLAKERGQGKKGSENRFSRWSDLIERMP